MLPIKRLIRDLAVCKLFLIHFVYFVNCGLIYKMYPVFNITQEHVHKHVPGEEPHYLYIYSDVCAFCTCTNYALFKLSMYTRLYVSRIAKSMILSRHVFFRRVPEQETNFLHIISSNAFLRNLQNKR